MKIADVQNKAIGRKSTTKKPRDGQAISFGSLLEGQLQPISESQPAIESRSISEHSSVSSSTRLDGLNLSEKTVDILAAFSEALDDLSLSPESLIPLVDALEGGTTAMLDIKEQLDADDPLAELLDRIAAVAYLETEKYRRGDYGRR